MPWCFICIFDDDDFGLNDAASPEVISCLSPVPQLRGNGREIVSGRG